VFTEGYDDGGSGPPPAAAAGHVTEEEAAVSVSPLMLIAADKLLHMLNALSQVRACARAGQMFLIPELCPRSETSARWTCSAAIYPLPIQPAFQPFLTDFAPVARPSYRLATKPPFRPFSTFPIKVILQPGAAPAAARSTWTLWCSATSGRRWRWQSTLPSLMRWPLRRSFRHRYCTTLYSLHQPTPGQQQWLARKNEKKRLSSYHRTGLYGAPRSSVSPKLPARFRRCSGPAGMLWLWLWPRPIA
jgi:hypothetical protein